MTKLLKISARTLGILMEWIVISVILFAFMIRTTPVQTYLAKKAASYLSKELGAKVDISSVSIVFIDKAAIDDLYIEDQHGDSLIYIKRLIASFDEIDLAKQRFVVGSIGAKNAFLHVQRDKEGNSNHIFLRDYFAKDTGKENKVFFKIKSATLENSKFKYDDHRKPVRDYGVDYFHLEVNNINAAVKNLAVKKDVITGQVTSVSGIEKSGFELKSLETFANVSPRGMKLSNLTLRSKNSIIESSKFNLLSKTYTSFLYFVDSVTFDGQIDKSSLDLSEVALFGYALKGMNNQVEFKTKLARKAKNLKLEDFEIKLEDRTKIKGTLNIADYRDFKKGFFHEKLDYAYIDFQEIKGLRLPDSFSDPYISLNRRMESMQFVEAFDVRLDGYFHQFVLSAKQLNSAVGSAQLANGIMFTENAANKSYVFSRSSASEYDVRVDNLQLGHLIKNNDIGNLSGIFHLNGEILTDNYIAFKEIVFHEISGDVDKFEYLNYPYTNITILEGTYEDQIFEGKIDVKDDYLNLAYDGKIDFKGKQKMEFTIDLTDAFLDNINISRKDSRLKSNFVVNLTGRNPDEMQGTIELDGFVYTANGKEIKVPSMTITASRSASVDRFEFNSSIGKAVIEGKLVMEDILDEFQFQLSRVFPALFRKHNQKTKITNPDHFTYDVELLNSQALFDVFVPGLSVAAKTTFKGQYYGGDANFTCKFNSGWIKYDDLKFDGISLDQVIDSNSVAGTIHVNRFTYNDSLNFDDIYFKTTGGKDKLANVLTWEQNTKYPSSLSWKTRIQDWDHFLVDLDPSYFHVKEHRWDIAHASKMQILNDTIAIDFFELTRGDQRIYVDGKISNQSKHHLNFKVDELEIAEISDFITNKYPMEGRMNGWGFIASPFTNLQYNGDASLIDFIVNKNKVGDIYLQSEWDNLNKSIAARGDLIYMGNETFNFDGDYYLDKEEDNLDFNLFFEYMDIQFTNAFIDPDVMREIRGILNGTVELTGTPEEPIVDGSVDLLGGSVYIDLLGVHFGVDGPIEVDEYGFYMNDIPVFDEEGNAGSLIGSVYHDNLTDFNFDLQFDLERDAINKDPINPWRVVYLDKFLLMDAEHTPDDLYYGKGYVTGEANIFGYTDNLEITVDVTTQKGTWINIPMYGVGEIDDENNFIVFKDKNNDTIGAILEPKFDFTGVDLNLNFDVTPDADLKVIFNEDNGDEISANGSGDIHIQLDNLNHVTMDGIYKIDKGIYNFVMGPVKQKFFIEQGGTINWSGDPYDANLNLKTYYQVNANIADISSDQIASGSGGHQQVLCYLNLYESLLKPEIQFDIKAPLANDVARSLINRITTDKEELNRQFFSLLLWKKFQPLTSSATADGSAAAELITNQINSMLSMVSDDYKLNVSYDSDNLSENKQYEFGITKGFLDNRLILSGSFGVENYIDESSVQQSGLIGDLSLEYLLNEDGTFRVNIFNESTDKTVIQEATLGKFTQGAGLSYKEEFNSTREFKALQYFLDIFRKRQNKRYPIKRKKQQRPVPEDNPSEGPRNLNGIIEEE